MHYDKGLNKVSSFWIENHNCQEKALWLRPWVHSKVEYWPCNGSTLVSVQETSGGTANKRIWKRRARDEVEERQRLGERTCIWGRSRRPSKTLTHLRYWNLTSRSSSVVEAVGEKFCCRAANQVSWNTTIDTAPDCFYHCIVGQAESGFWSWPWPILTIQCHIPVQNQLCTSVPCDLVEGRSWQSWKQFRNVSSKRNATRDWLA